MSFCFSPTKGSLKNVKVDGGQFQKPEPAGSTAPPPLASYEYPTLPITKHRQELISLVENNSVVIIRGATGSGKTTQLPQFILDHYSEKNAPCNIVVTQARKIGASSIARWVANQRKCTLGSVVGYQVGLEKMATEHTRLIYMTTGVLLQKLVSSKCLTEFSHIFVDEVHERTEEMDFLLLVLRKLLHSNSAEVKIILMSATINCREFAEYFCTTIQGKMNPAYVFEVEGTPFAIEEFYLDDLYKLYPYRVILSTNIAESSVTVPDVKYGRAGRVSKGYCYRLVTKEFWKNEIPEYMIPEMLLAPLANIMLKVKLLDMGDPRSLLSTALSPPNLSDIVRTVLQLKEMGALSAKSYGRGQNEDGELTFLGRVLAHLPVDLYLGKMVVLGHIFGCLDECLIIAASHSMKSFFAIPSMQQLAGHRSKLAFARGTPSDSIAIVNAFKDELNWGKENFVQIKRIREAAELYEDLKNRVSQFNMYVPENAQPSDYTSTHRQKFILQVVIAGAYYPNYFVQGEIDETLASRELSGFNPRTTVMLRKLPPYSFLYYKQLQSLFRPCGQVKTISFDNSRAFVEFYRTSQDTGVLPEVSLALLMAQLSSPIELSVYPIEQIEDCTGNTNITHMKCARVNVDFQSHSVCPVGMLSNIDPDKLPPNPLFVVHITKVLEVGHFWGFRADEASLEKQRHMTAEINKRTLKPVTVSLYPNLLCLAPYSEFNDQSMYYRAKILHMRGNSIEDNVVVLQVSFLDFGNTSVVDSNSLRELPSDLLSHPFQAQEFQVTEMCPSAQSIILGNQWSSQARDRFITLVKGHSLLVLLYSILHDVMRVQLLINTERTNRSVVDILVEEGHAVKAEESFDSKAHLRGPFSPNKIQFHSLSRRALYKTVCIEKSSINSLALSDTPHYKHQRVLVAGTVSVNPTGTRILLRDTTNMPDIPGLPSLITMLFTPIMELRTDKERTCYTGALCGLGWNSQTNEAILPEHDIELTFDVKFDVEDITEINALRVAINRMVCEGALHLGPERTSHMQEDCRDRLIRLFTKSPPREAVTPVYYEKPEKWNQVDPALKMDVVEPGYGSSRVVLFQLHPVTLLNH
ncbi:putative ATP-dependent RNA helicase TDRD9 [Collichthys lucidus]|uniref:RNA helicase n=1 Tax=Collichthys lucidus TaxID=240159 RepID=A0A4U5VEU5_COLLU|nr:putative ATP-dependent RNA helicase TDRD9 [Collichthys lucidus]